MAYVLSHRYDGVVVLTLNDPSKRNAINLAMNQELANLLDELESSSDVGAIVLTGAPPAFCAGADLDDLMAASHHDSLHEIYRGFLRVAHSPLPTIAAVNGPAVGAGMNFALACDVILAARSARFDTRFLHIGIHPGGGHTWRLREKTDDQTVKAMVLFGEALSGEAAAARGLAWRCVDDDQLMTTAMDLARRVAAYPPKLVRATKATINAMSEISTSTAAVDRELGPQANSMTTPEFQERVRAMQAAIRSKG